MDEVFDHNAVRFDIATRMGTTLALPTEVVVDIIQSCAEEVAVYFQILIVS